MNRSFVLVPLFAFIALLGACNEIPEKHWTAALPYYTPVVISSPADTSPTDFLFGDVMDVLDPMTPASREKTQQLLTYVTSEDLQPLALVILPHTADNWMPVLVLHTTRNLLPPAASHFARPYTGNSYEFNGMTVYELYLNESDILYAAQLHRTVLISESSRALEEMIRAYTDKIKSLDLNPDALTAGKVVFNAGHLDRYISLETAVRLRPALNNAFQGAGTAVMNIVNNENATGSEQPVLSFSGSFDIDEPAGRSSLIRAVTSRNHNLVLDRYISQDVSVAALFSRPADMIFYEEESEAPVDRYLRANPDVFTNIAGSLGPNFAFAAFASTGVQNVGETAYLRMLDDRRLFVRELDALLDQDIISSDTPGTYLIRGASLSRLVSGGLTSYDIHYLTVSGDAVIITQRPGLAQKLVNDRNRRRTLYYAENYPEVRSQFPDQLSGFLYAQREDLLRYASSLLNTVHAVDILVNQFDVLATGIELNSSGNGVQWHIKTYEIEQTTRPFEERWLVTLDNTGLSGRPVFADLAGGPRNEIVAATNGGLVVALAADGTQLFRVNTNADVPVGAPAAYDWYANNQQVILQGAGNKIYAWNSNGNLLPNFPIELSEPLSAPVRIADVTRNGLPEIIAATRDRMIHVLDQRGNNITGWPQSVNSPVTEQPIVQSLGNRRVIFAYAENVLFAWDQGGSLRNGYPVFNRSPLRGPLLWDNDHILAGSADGTVIAVGYGNYFSDEYAVSLTSPDSGEIRIQGLELTNGEVLLHPGVDTYRIDVPETDENGDTLTTTYTEPLLFVQAANGSVMGISRQGALRFTQTLGQPPAAGFSPVIADLNRDGRPEVLSLAGFGRMYAWTLQNAGRFMNIPATAVQFPAVTDLFANNRMEIVAGTREGLRAWTINETATSTTD